jgi:hypothetical protein
LLKKKLLLLLLGEKVGMEIRQALSGLKSGSWRRRRRRVVVVMMKKRIMAMVMALFGGGWTKKSRSWVL